MSMDYDEMFATEIAAHNCASCKKNKRKCDKKLTVTDWEY